VTEAPARFERRLHAEAVRGGWRMIETLQRMTPEVARKLLADHWAAQAHHAAETLVFLKPWDRVPERALRVYRNTPDQVRMRRILDFIEPGDRLLDIGAGYGYLTGVILRDSEAGYYAGIDLGEHIVESSQQMIEVNGLHGRAVHLEPMDLYDLSPEWVAEHKPDLMICCEVLEHVPDAEKALSTIAATIPASGALLFSVPILGRLEACWGHLSLFDVARIQQMVARAGLHVQHVEPLYNTWALVLVSPQPEPLPRLARVLARPPAVPAPTATASNAWDRLPLTQESVTRSRWHQRTRQVRIQHDKGGVRCRVSGSAARSDPVSRLLRRFVQRLPRRVTARLQTLTTGQGQYGGLSVQLPGTGFAALRLELSFSGGHGIHRVYVDANDGAIRVGRWRWPVTSTEPSDTFTTFVLRPDQPTSHFAPVGRFDLGRARTVDVFVEISPGATVEFALQRAAVVARPARTAG
jgi:2-polyprenyl-3-methyl-5-hydroxy-6-metoxy-1,4-benzoquinol methylase